MKMKHLTTSCATAALLLAGILACTPSTSEARGRTSRGTITESNDARGGGLDDPANHDANDDRTAVQVAGADDGVGHDANNDRGRGRGRGGSTATSGSHRGRGR